MCGIVLEAEKHAAFSGEHAGLEPPELHVAQS